MKKILLFSSIILFGSMVSFAQTYATDFTANDCDGNPHNLFSELDAGKVIVLAWVMPCATCIADPLEAYTEVTTYSASHPDRVHFYLADDFADNTCQTLSSWAANYGMAACTKFSDPSIDMFKYGYFGMPKIVVLGYDRRVYFEKNESADGIREAIDQALVGVTGIGKLENKNSNIELSSFPNPANNIINVKYTLRESSTVSIEVINAVGKIMSIQNKEQKAQGSHESKFDTSFLSNGIYFIKVTTNQGIEIGRFTISH